MPACLEPSRHFEAAVHSGYCSEVLRCSLASVAQSLGEILLPSLDWWFDTSKSLKADFHRWLVGCNRSVAVNSHS